VPGLYATESAMNELADQLRSTRCSCASSTSPRSTNRWAFRFRHATCWNVFQVGSENFRLVEAHAGVGSMKRDGLTLGGAWPGCSWIAARFPAEASVELRDDATARVACGTPGHRTGT